MALLDFTGSPHGGSLRLLPEWDRQPRITPTTIIDHSIVGSAVGAWTMFRDSSGLESHFIVRGRRSGSLDGHVWQLMDTGRRADANFHANTFALSIETEDDGDPDTQPWTQAQLDSLAWLHDKLRRVHPSIPRARCTSCFGGGLGYHSLCPTTSVNPWTPAVGKSCPGQPVRVRQWETVLLPAFLTLTQEDDMPTQQEVEDAVAAAIQSTKDELAKEVARTVPCPHLFVSANDQRGVFAVTALGLVHVDGPAAFAALSGGRPLGAAPNGPIQLVSAAWLDQHLAGEG